MVEEAGVSVTSHVGGGGSGDCPLWVTVWVMPAATIVAVRPSAPVCAATVYSNADEPVRLVAPLTVTHGADGAMVHAQDASDAVTLTDLTPPVADRLCPAGEISKVHTGVGAGERAHDTNARAGSTLRTPAASLRHMADFPASLRPMRLGARPARPAHRPGSLPGSPGKSPGELTPPPRPGTLRSMFPGVSRRRFLACLAAAPVLRTVPALASVSVLPSARALSFVHLHTSERLSLDYAREGGYLPDALAALNHLLRDFRTGDVAPIDPGLFDLLYRLRVACQATAPFQIISGYRSPVTNATLRERSSGVASGSLHMSGKAIDIRVAGVGLATLRDAAIALQLGGVGYYPGSNFVHVDTGRVRRW